MLQLLLVMVSTSTWLQSVLLKRGIEFLWLINQGGGIWFAEKTEHITLADASMGLADGLLSALPGIFKHCNPDQPVALRTGLCSHSGSGFWSYGWQLHCKQLASLLTSCFPTAFERRFTSHNATDPRTVPYTSPQSQPAWLRDQLGSLTAHQLHTQARGSHLTDAWVTSMQLWAAGATGTMDQLSNWGNPCRLCMSSCCCKRILALSFFQGCGRKNLQVWSYAVTWQCRYQTLSQLA